MCARIATTRFESPIGAIGLSADDGSLISVRIAGTTAPPGDLADHPILIETVRQLRAWFAGDLQNFALPLQPPPTQDGAVLRAGIASIPYGQTRTYGALALQTGSGARAVGQGCRTNPYPIIIPCHRVTSTSGREYYSGGAGARTKTWLIDFEYDHLPPEKRTRLL